MVTDSNGCVKTASVTITHSCGLSARISSQVNVLCFGGNNGSATASAAGGTGTKTFSWNTTPVQTTATASGLSAGTYTVTVTDANGCTATANATITQPAAVLSASISSQVNVLCFGGNNESGRASCRGRTGIKIVAGNTTQEQTTATASGWRART